MCCRSNLKWWEQWFWPPVLLQYAHKVQATKLFSSVPFYLLLNQTAHFRTHLVDFRFLFCFPFSFSWLLPFSWTLVLHLLKFSVSLACAKALTCWNALCASAVLEMLQNITWPKKKASFPCCGQLAVYECCIRERGVRKTFLMLQAGWTEMSCWDDLLPWAACGRSCLHSVAWNMWIG